MCNLFHVLSALCAFKYLDTATICTSRNTVSVIWTEENEPTNMMQARSYRPYELQTLRQYRIHGNQVPVVSGIISIRNV